MKTFYNAITPICPIAVKDAASIPLLLEKVKAGFPSPADDYVEKNVDMNELLIKHKTSTFLFRVSGNSMINAGIFDNDLLVVDRAVQPQNENIVVASVNGELTVKTIRESKGTLSLLPHNREYEPIKITQEMDFEIWGVVTFCIHDCR
jgi:DNA polymerase V